MWLMSIVIQPRPVGRECSSSSKTVDLLVEEAESAPTLEQAATYWHQADEHVMADAWFIPLQTSLIPLFRSQRVHNAVIGPGAEGYVPFNDYPTKDNQGDPGRCKNLLAAAELPKRSHPQGHLHCQSSPCSGLPGGPVGLRQVRGDGQRHPGPCRFLRNLSGTN